MDALSDRIGRKPMLAFCCAAFAVLAYPGFQLIQQTGTPIAPTFYLIAAALASGATILFFRETAFERLR